MIVYYSDVLGSSTEVSIRDSTEGTVGAQRRLVTQWVSNDMLMKPQPLCFFCSLKIKLGRFLDPRKSQLRTWL